MIGKNLEEEKIFSIGLHFYNTKKNLIGFLNLQFR